MPVILPLTSEKSSGGTYKGDTAPEDASLLWIDTSDNNILKYYDGDAWVAVKTEAVWG